MSKPNYPASFKHISTDELDEYRGQGYLFEHIQSGCQIYHVLNDDEENLFSFNFRTPPADSSGVAHILEHSVLCGSKKFPVKDPFLSMMKGSVNTFLNAMTYPDKTLYPAASVLEKDYFNLMDVYGDAVFFPNLNEEVFRQEGHRLEWDDQGRLVRTGIVYNEMKGNYSSQEGIASEWCIRSLFPDNPYGVDSGGEPESIPSLSYEEFVDFHKAWYHPSNCKIFLYGNIPSEKILSFLDSRFLGEFQAKKVDSFVPLQKSWTEPRILEKTWPLGEDDTGENKSTISLNWKIFAPDDPVRSLSMSILTEMLMGNAGAPLHKALLESGLGEDLSPVSGLPSVLIRS
jgi:Zn-dependent M16 (insulinase) family peptidase